MDPIAVAVTCTAQDGGIAVTEIASTFIAALALGFTGWQMWLQREHNRKMSMPHLSGWNHYAHGPELYAYTLENVGLGPAIIKAIRLEVDGNVIEGEGADLIQNATRILFDDMPSQQAWEMFTVGEVTPAGKKYEILSITPSRHTAEEVAELLRSRARLLIDYESILGDKFVFDSETH
nr:hypothetical protein [Pseudomonas sp. NFPP33]